VQDLSLRPPGYETSVARYATPENAWLRIRRAAETSSDRLGRAKVGPKVLPPRGGKQCVSASPSVLDDHARLRRQGRPALGARLRFDLTNRGRAARALDPGASKETLAMLCDPPPSRSREAEADGVPNVEVGDRPPPMHRATPNRGIRCRCLYMLRLSISLLSHQGMQSIRHIGFETHCLGECEKRFKQRGRDGRFGFNKHLA
jgi:hypothetical protein